MESNGMPGRIHVSQATADALTLAGKSHWLIAREEKIVAKGTFPCNWGSFRSQHRLSNPISSHSAFFLLKFTRQRRNANLLGAGRF